MQEITRTTIRIHVIALCLTALIILGGIKVGLNTSTEQDYTRYYVVTNGKGEYRLTDGDWISPQVRKNRKEACDMARSMTVDDSLSTIHSTIDDTLRVIHSKENWKSITCSEDSL